MCHIPPSVIQGIAKTLNLRVHVHKYTTDDECDHSFLQLMTKKREFFGTYA